MANNFAAYSVLLVSEAQGRVSATLGYLVIQRHLVRGQCFPLNGEGNVAKEEGLRAAFAFSGQVFGWSKQPVEGDDDEVEDNFVEHAPFFVVQVQDLLEFPDDGQVGWVGSSGRVVVVAELFVIS